MRNPKHFCAQGAGSARHSSTQGEWGRRNLEHNLREERRRTPYDDKGAPGADIERSGKLQQLLAFLVLTADEDRDRNG